MAAAAAAALLGILAFVILRAVSGRLAFAGRPIVVLESI
jgi:hypothetical protein